MIVILFGLLGVNTFLLVLILRKLKEIKRKEVKEMGLIEDLTANIVDLQAKVQADTDVENSAITVLTALNTKIAELSQQLADAIALNDPVAIKAAADAIAAQTAIVDANTKALAAAIVATP